MMISRSAIFVLCTAFLILATTSGVSVGQSHPEKPMVRAMKADGIAVHSHEGPIQSTTTNPPGFRELTVLEETVTVSPWSRLTGVHGEIRNDNEITVAIASLQVVALDNGGQLLDAVRTSVSGVPPCEPYEYPQALLKAGGTNAFSVFLNCEFSEVATVLIRAIGSEWSYEPCEIALDLMDEWDIEDQDEWIALRGTIRNTIDRDIIDLRVTVVARASSGEIVNLVHQYPWAEIIGGYTGGLREGEELEVMLHLNIPFDDLDSVSLETSITGRPYYGARFEYGVVGIAHSPGVNGSVWRSSLAATNLSGAPASAVLTYYHSGGQADALLELLDGESVFYEDVARTLFSVAGQSSGYIQITSSAPLTFTGRTSNESNIGGFGQSLPVYTPEMTRLWFGDLSGLRGGEAFRTNIGLVNMATGDCTCRVRLFRPNGDLLRDFAEIELSETEWFQLNDVIPEHVEVAYATIDPGQGCWMWAYASVIEEATGDPTTIEVEPPTVIDLAPVRGAGFLMGGWPEQELPVPPQ
jgi:hypothetical protein